MIDHSEGHIYVHDLIPNETQAVLANISRELFTAYSEAYLVGGSLRNLLIGQPCMDWDITLPGSGHKLAQTARQLANKVGGFFVHLHEKAERIVVKHGVQEIIIDLAPMEGDSIETDLRRRDFTINAVAVPLQSFARWLMDQRENNWMQAIKHLVPLCIDPHAGIAASVARQIHAVTNDIFVQDPLRMLRALRLATRYRLTIETTTQQLIQRSAPLLVEVAAERIYPELSAILAPPGAAERLRTLDELGLFTVIFPEFIAAHNILQPQPNHHSIFDHALETVTMFEHIAQIMNVEFFPVDRKDISAFLTPNEPMDEATYTDLHEIYRLLQEAKQQETFDVASLRGTSMKLAALLHDIGKIVSYSKDKRETMTSDDRHEQADLSITTSIAQRLRLPVHERRVCALIVANHKWPFLLAQQPLTSLEIHRYFVALGNDGISVALMALAEGLVVYDSQLQTEQWSQLLKTVRLLLNGYIRERKRILPPRLLHGDELMQQFELKPGPLVGRLLVALAEAQVSGQVRTHDEALRFTRRQILQEERSREPG